MKEKVFESEFMVKPSVCNATRNLPLQVLVSQMIDLATDHANELGIGFLKLESEGLGWVLSRLSVEMKRWPSNGETYKLSTWIETYNCHFSERCFSVITPTGEILGYARTIWVIIRLRDHTCFGTADTKVVDDLIAGVLCPIPRMMRPKLTAFTYEAEYVFRYSDIDFYGHVNTIRYIDLLLNQFTLEDFMTRFVSRFDIAFANEAKYGQRVLIQYYDEMSVGAPSMVDNGLNSFKRHFSLTIDRIPILTSSFVLTSH